MVDDLSTAIASLCRTINCHDSWAHHLPPELLVAVVSHLKDVASLLAATQVCHFWRTALLSFPCLWTSLDFANEERALAFLERSKSTPLRIDVDNPSAVVKESLNGVTARMTTLRAAHNSFLDELLDRPMPILEVLEITESDEDLAEKPIRRLPSLTALVISGFNTLRFHAPVLTSFHLTHDFTRSFPGWTVKIVLDFLRSCPLLEVAFLSCDDPDPDPNSGSDVISLPLLRSFTHESSSDEYHLCLFNRLSLPSTCRVVFEIDVTEYSDEPWIPGLPTPRDPSYLSNIRIVKISASTHRGAASDDYTTFKIELTSPEHAAISFDRTSYHDQHSSLFSDYGLSDIFEGIETSSVETLCFRNYPLVPYYMLSQVTPTFVTEGLREFPNLKTLILADCDIVLSLDDISVCPAVDTLVVYSMHITHCNILPDQNVPNRLQKFVASRKAGGLPLKVLTLIFPLTEPQPPELEQLKGCVGRLEVVGRVDALRWNLDKYLLGAITHKGDTSGL